MQRATLLPTLLLLTCLTTSHSQPSTTQQPGHPTSSAAQGGQQQRSHHMQLRPVTSFLPYCTYLAARLPAHEHATLRNAVQQVLYYRKRERDLQELIHMNQSPQDDPKIKAAFKTPKTIAQLQHDLGLASSNVTQYTAAFNTLLTDLTARGHLPSNATFDYVSQCLSSRLDPGLFPYTPQVSFLLQYFRRPHVIDQYVSRLRAVSEQYGIHCELLVNVDSITEHQQWAELAGGNGEPADTVHFWLVPVLSANIHEARAYNRLAALARSPVLVFLQDDDLPPRDGVWVQNLLSVFGTHPKTAAVGMQAYRYCVQGFNNQYQGQFYFVDPQLKLKLHFASVVDFAPMAVRKHAFEEVGGLDEGMSEPGVCGIYGDWELSIRFWVAGWHVMYMEVNGREGDGQEGGTHKPETGERCWNRQMYGASSTFNRRYAAVMPLVCDHVKHLNVELLQVLDSGQPCPFGQDKCVAGGG